MSLETLFSRYGSPSTECNQTIHCYLLRADYLKTSTQIVQMDQSATRYLAEFEALAADMRAYRQTLATRYAELEIMPYHLRLELERHKRDSVAYYLRLVKVYEDGSEVNEESHTYSGTERHKALQDYESMRKARPGIECRKDIAKGKWER